MYIYIYDISSLRVNNILPGLSQLKYTQIDTDHEVKFGVSNRMSGNA